MTATLYEIEAYRLLRHATITAWQPLLPGDAPYVAPFGADGTADGIHDVPPRAQVLRWLREWSPPADTAVLVLAGFRLTGPVSLGVHRSGLAIMVNGAVKPVVSAPDDEDPYVEALMQTFSGERT